MRSLSPSEQEALRQIFQQRLSLDPMECRLYSHDVGSLPGLVRSLIGAAAAAAIVQPESEEELVRLVEMANAHRIPVVPRGKATSGYGGVLPVQGGIVVDFHRLRDVVTVDREHLTITVQPGIVWEDLRKALEKQDLALRLYPSSAPSSTVGGWLAQGGFGYGSFEYGSFRDSVVSARVVLPTGTVREFGGDDLDLISDAEGITGLIGQVTLRVRPLEEERLTGARFAGVKGLVAALQAVVAEGLPLWSVSFINPRMAHLKNIASPDEEHGFSLPEGYLALFVYPASRATQITPALERIIAGNGGEQLPPEIARHEWEDRFCIMKVKRLGPSLIPAEVLVPLENLAQALVEIETTIQQPLVIEGMIVEGNQTLLLGFILHDERSFAYDVAFGLALSAIKIAKKHGGSGYASGLYLAKEAENILGLERVQRLRAFKEEVDPLGIMNPGKVLDRGLIGTFVSLAGYFEPLVRAVGNVARSPVGERPEGAGKRGIPDDVAWYAYVCAQCGYCVGECDSFYGHAWESYSSRGKLYFLREHVAGRAELTPAQADTFYDCTLCDRCHVVCPLGIKTRELWITMRERLVERDLFPEGMKQLRDTVTTHHNISGDPNENRLGWSANLERMPEGLDGKKGAEVVYFTGCVGAFYPMVYEVPRSFVTILERAGVDFTTLSGDEWCCGYPLIIAGMGKHTHDLIRHNVEAVRALGARRLVTTCPSCYHTWTHDYPRVLGEPPGFEVVHATQLLHELLTEGRLELDRLDWTVTYHDPCDLGRNSGIYEEPRAIIRAIPGIQLTEMADHHQRALCCGGGGDVELSNADLKWAVARRRLAQAQDTGATVIVSACQQCQRTLAGTARKERIRLKVMDVSELVARAMER